MKKILITGAFSTGKTSLIRLVDDKLKLLSRKTLIINEVARECPFDLNKNQDLISSSWMVMRQLQNELEIDINTYDFAIFDRGLPDIISHVEYIAYDDKDRIFTNQLRLLAKASCNRYDYVFFSRISDKFKINDDGVRIVDYDFQRELEKLHLDCLEQLGIPYINLPEKNPERLDFILRAIL